MSYPAPPNPFEAPPASAGSPPSIVGEVVALVGGGVLFASAWLPWYRFAFFGGSLTRSGWQSPHSELSSFAALLGLAGVAGAIVLLALHSTATRSVHLGLGLGLAGAGGLALLMVVAKYFANDDTPVLSFRDYASTGFLVGGAGALTLAVAGVLVASLGQHAAPAAQPASAWPPTLGGAGFGYAWPPPTWAGAATTAAPWQQPPAPPPPPSDAPDPSGVPDPPQAGRPTPSSPPTWPQSPQPWAGYGPPPGAIYGTGGPYPEYQPYSPYPSAPAQTNGLAIASLVAGLLWCWGVTGVVALVLGYVAKRQIDESGGQQSGRGLAIAGIVLGWISVAAGVLAVIGVSTS